MTKEAFLSQLQSCMAAKNVDRESAEKFLQRFEKIMNSTPPGELPQKIASFGRPEDIAARIGQLSATGTAPVTGTVSPPAAGKGAQVRPAAPSPAKRNPAGEKPAGNPAGPSRGQTGTPQGAASAGAAKGPGSGYGQGQTNPRKEGGRAPARASQPAAKPGNPESDRPASRENAGGRSGNAPRSREEQRAVISRKGERSFWWTVVLTSPIWGFLLCALMAAFLLAYTAILFVAAALIIFEVALIVGGVLLAVVGVVYGIMQMLPGAEAAYIGLYELGLGIRIGGFTMLFSIIVYNIVVNFTPLALKQLTRFLKFTVKSIGGLVERIRKEFGKL